MRLQNKTPALGLEVQGRGSRGDEDACTDESTARQPKRQLGSEAAKVPRDKFVWRGFSLHLGRSKKSLLTVVPDERHSHLYRIKYPDGWTSSPANITRAHDTAYGHVRYLLGAETPPEATYSPEDEIGIGREAA
jgi:hypothetical protein